MRTGQSHRWLSFPPKRPTSDCVTDPITDYRPNSPPAKLSPQTPVNDYSTMPQPAKAKQPPQTHPYRTKPSLPQLPPKTPGKCLHDQSTTNKTTFANFVGFLQKNTTYWSACIVFYFKGPSTNFGWLHKSTNTHFRCEELGFCIRKTAVTLLLTHLPSLILK